MDARVDRRILALRKRIAARVGQIDGHAADDRAVGIGRACGPERLDVNRIALAQLDGIALQRFARRRFAFIASLQDVGAFEHAVGVWAVWSIGAGVIRHILACALGIRTRRIAFARITG